MSYAKCCFHFLRWKKGFVYDILQYIVTGLFLYERRIWQEKNRQGETVGCKMLAYQIDDLIRKNPFEFQLAAVVVNDSVTRGAITRKQERAFLEFVGSTTVSIKCGCPGSHPMYAGIRFVPTWQKAA